MDKILNPLFNKVKELTEGLVITPALTLHDYHRRVGEIHGIQQAIGIIVESLREQDEDDD